MSRKSQRKKTKRDGSDRLKSRLRKEEILRNTRFVSHRLGEEKMSEVLMKFVSPYTIHAGTEERWKKLLGGVAVIAWNASMFPPEERRRIIDEQIDHKVTSMPDEAKEIINALLDRKDKYFSSYDKIIVDFELAMTSEGPHLTVAYVKKRDRAAEHQ